MRPPRARSKPSSIDRLDPQIKELIGQLRIDHGWTIDEIRKRLLDLGQSVSRSALARHTKSLEEIGAQLRHSREVAKALIQQVGDAPEDRTADLNVELMHSMVLRLLTATNDEGDGAPIILDPKEVSFLAGSLKDLAGARKTNADTIFRVRQEASKEAAKRAEGAAKAQGLSADTVAAIRHAVLGSDG